MLVAALAAVVVAAVVAAVVVVRVQSRERARDAAAASAAKLLASAWEDGDLSRARFTGTSPAEAQARYAAVVKGLGGAEPSVRVVSTERDGATATARLAVTWPFGDGWSYRTTARLAPVADDGGGPWGAQWSPTLVHPSLHSGDRLTAARTAAARGAVLGRGGSPLVTEQPVVEVGVQPSRTTDPAGLAAQLAGVVDVDAAALTTAITKASPDAFVPVITLRQPDYDAVRARLQPLPGTVFRRSTLPLAPTPAFARALLGRVGPATQEIVEASDGRVVAGDTTGVSGLQRSADAVLAGTPGTTVRRVSDGAAASGAAAQELFTADAVPGKPVELTLDARVQQAADAALTTARSNDPAPRAALVAIDIPSGDVLAVANTPTTGADRALTGRYPPGSTLKTVTTTALLGTGLTPETAVPCPPTTTVRGQTYQNFEGEAFGDVPFRTDFAQSCNTAFVDLSSRLGARDLPTAAASVGLGGDWRIGVDAFTGSVPSEDSAGARAAASIGQGKNLASPLAMAVVASTIARGGWVAPHLVTDPAPPAATGGAPAPDAGRLAVVRDLMRSVVTSGTASALADVPGDPVIAKTGTAEYGTTQPLKTHTWVVGAQGDLAFAVLVENGTSGATTAVPVAEAFLRSLAG